MKNIKSRLSALLKDNKRLIIPIAIVWALFMALIFLHPFSGDDWAWGSEAGVDRVKIFFMGYNGRFLGNYLVFLLTRSEALSVIVISMSMVAICIFPMIIARKKSLTLFFIGVTLLFVMPQPVFVQSIMWTSGFTNYIPSIIITLSYLALSLSVFEKGTEHFSKGKIGLCATLGFAGCLFMESITGYNILVGITILVFSRIKFKKALSPFIAYMIGAVCGTVLMLANPAYFKAASGTDFYRTFAWNDVTIILDHLKSLCNYFLIQNLIILSIISALLIPLAVMGLKHRTSKTCRNGIYISLFVNLFTLGIFITKRIFANWQIIYHRPNAATVFLTLCAILHLASILYMVISCVKDMYERIKLSFLLISVAVLLAPFIVISPLNERCVSPAYVILLVFCVLLFDLVFTSYGVSRDCIKVVGACALALFIGIYAFYISVYSVVFKYEKLRLEYIDKQIELGITSEVVLTRLPYSSHVWMGTPFEDSELWEGYFKDFYGIDKSVTFKTISPEEFDKWKIEFDKSH